MVRVSDVLLGVGPVRVHQRPGAQDGQVTADGFHSKSSPVPYPALFSSGGSVEKLLTPATPPPPAEVVEIPFTRLANGSYDPVAAADSMAGYSTVFSASNPMSCQANGLTESNCVRLTAASWDPAGRGLFVGSDNSLEGEVYLLSKAA